MSEDDTVKTQPEATSPPPEAPAEASPSKSALGSRRDLPRRVHPLWVGVIAVVCIVAGFVGGYEAHTSSTSKASTTTTPSFCGAPGGSSTLTVTAAGTLDTAFPDIASVLANVTPGIQIPSASQTYEGSLSALGLISNLHECFDVAAAADFRLIPNMLENGSQASWEVSFASNPEVLCYVPSLAAPGGPLYGVNTTNWGWMVQRSGVNMGVANASTDPNGYNEIFVMELQGLVYNASQTSVYSHFFTGSPGSYAHTTSAALTESETNFATLLSAGTIDTAITYQSYAISHHLSYVALNPLVGLGNFTTADLSSYAQVSTTILGSNGGPNAVIKGAPVVFSATVPTQAPNATLGMLFVHALLSSVGTSELASLGFTPVTPAYWQATSGTNEPSLLTPYTTPLPASLSGDL